MRMHVQMENLEIAERISSHMPTRREAGLPNETFVFCCFNNNCKVTAPYFRKSPFVWCQPHSKRCAMPMRKLLVAILVNMLLTAVLLEVGLQLINLVSKKVLQPPTTWEEYFLRSYMETGTLVYAGIHQPHPTRGWSMKPSANSATSPDIHYTTNRQGYRALYDFANKPDKYQVLIVGDSYTFGDDIDDQYTWPHLLQQQNAKLNVFNMGGTGYGTDQMLITLQEEISAYKPDLVIAAFIGNDLYRATLPFRDYKKPRFLLSRSGELYLTNTPVGNIPEVINEIVDKGSFSYSPIQTINLFNILTHQLTPVQQPACNCACGQLNTAIFLKMQQLTSVHNAEFLMIYLPRGIEIHKSEGTSDGEIFFEHYRTEHPGNYLNPRRQFLDATFEKVRGHYHKNETTLLSQLVMQKIASLKSWQCKQDRNAECKPAIANP